MQYNSKVTAFCAFYKRADVAERTLKSISKQSYKDMTALVWDDCSDDNTYSSLLKSKSLLNDERIIVFQNKENIGITASFNEALKRCSSEYIAIIGSGDECAPERISKQVAYLEKHSDAAFCACKSITVDEVTGKLFKDESHNNTLITHKDIIDTVPFTHGTVVYRRSSIENVGGFEPIFKWCADWDLLLRILNSGHGVFLDETLYTRYARLDGVSFNPDKSLEQIQYKYLAKHLDSDKKNRNRSIAEAKENLLLSLRKYHPEISKDLEKRACKLALMGRTAESKSLVHLTDRSFGKSILRSIKVKTCIALNKTKINPDHLINISRKITNRKRQ